MLDPLIAQSIKYIYENERLDGIFAVHHKHKVLNESTQYFWDNVERIARIDYVPTHLDIINVRAPSIGIIEKILSIEKIHFHFFDVGGQKSERRKWIECFDNVTAIIFVVSLSCYNEVLFEQTSIGKMEDALQLFDDTISRNIFKDVALTDDETFSDFDGSDAHDFAQTSAFIENKFVAINNAYDREMYVHLTCAVDQKDINNVFAEVNHVILANNLKNGGLFI